MEYKAIRMLYLWNIVLCIAIIAGGSNRAFGRLSSDREYVTVIDYVTEFEDILITDGARFSTDMTTSQTKTTEALWSTTTEDSTGSLTLESTDTTSTDLMTDQPTNPTDLNTEQPTAPTDPKTEKYTNPTGRMTEPPTNPTERMTESSTNLSELMTEPPTNPTELKTEQPTNPTERMTERMTEQPTNPTERMTERMTEQPTNPTERMTEQPTNPTGRMTEQPTNPSERITEQPTTPTEQMTEQPTTPTEQMTEQPTNPTERMTEQPTNPTEHMTEQPTNPTERMTEQPTNPTGRMTDQPINPTELMTEQATNPTERMTEQPTNPTEQMTDQPTNPTELMTEQPTNPTERMTEQPTNPTERMTDQPTNPTERMTEQPTNPTERMIEQPTNPTEPASHTDPGTEVFTTSSDIPASVLNTDSSKDKEILPGTTKELSTSSNTDHASTLTTESLTTQQRTEPRETTMIPTTTPTGCVMPANLDPDISPSEEKDHYDIGDFILLYCPPPPYVFSGVVFSQCTEAGWSPDFTDNACYAPCPAPTVPSYLTHHDDTSGDTRDEYDHGKTIAFSCVISWKVLSSSPSLTCVDGVWDAIDYPTCEDPVCTLPADFDPDIIVNVEKDEYNIGDFILLYCPPIPYATRGETFSSCTEGRWEPDISDNACYAPCEPVEASGPLTVTLTAGLERDNKYTHDSTLAFSCTRGTLSGPSEIVCVDGSWDPADQPTCMSAGSTLAVTTLEPKPVFTQEYFTLPPDGENCTVYPTILDSDVYVIPQQSRVDNQFIHGDSFLLYCNDTISTPMIWFTFCWDSRWYPDPAKRFCYRTCDAPSVESNVIHSLSVTGKSSASYYLHGDTINFSCTKPDRSTLIGPSSSICKDGTWDPDLVPTCEVSSTTDSLLTTLPLISTMDITTIMTDPSLTSDSETSNPASGDYTSPPVIDPSSEPMTPLSMATRDPLETDPPTWVPSASTDSNPDTSSASTSETSASLDNSPYQTSILHTWQTEGVTTVAPQTISDQTDQSISATSVEGVTFGTLVSTAHGPSTLHSDTQPATFVSSSKTSYQSTEQPTTVHVYPTMSARSTTLAKTSKPTDPDKKTTTLPTEPVTTMTLTTEPQEPGCVLPADFDPDITLSSTKARYDIGDFIILSCPPPPYKAVGEVFSQCSDFGWLPDISGNACYAPCPVPLSLPTYLTHHDQSTGDTLMEYTHGAVLTFECTDTSKVLSHTSSPMCVDGVWEDLDYPTCEDPVCTIPGDLDDDIIINPEKVEYIEDDFILLYCPPVPYSTRGTPFSVCENGKWDPAISDNACYAPCDPPDLLGPVTYTQSNGLFRFGQYTHDSVLEFTCTSGLLDGPTGLACIDGVWHPDAVPSCIYDETSQRPTVFTQEPRPVFTQEYFTLPPDGQNCTTYPNILDDDIYVIPQQSRVDNQFIHGDSFLLYCNDTISTPMIWFTFCWDSRWYPDPATRFCYRYCEIPDVSSDVHHYLASSGISSTTFYEHSREIRFNCSSQRQVLQGTDTMVCFDGKWSPDEPPTCTGSSTTSILTTPFLSSAYTLTDDWTSISRPLTTDLHFLKTSDIPISQSTFGRSVTTSRHFTSTVPSEAVDITSANTARASSTGSSVTDAQTDFVTPEHDGTNSISTISMLTSTTSATDADYFTSAFTSSESTAEKQTTETAASKTGQTEHLTTKITNPFGEHTTDITIDGETDKSIVSSETVFPSLTQDVTLLSTASFVTGPQLNTESSTRTVVTTTSQDITETHALVTTTVERQTVAASQRRTDILPTATRHNTAMATNGPTSHISLPGTSTAIEDSTSVVTGMSRSTSKTTARQTEAGTTTLVSGSGVSSEVPTAPLLTTKPSLSTTTYSVLTSKAAESTVSTSWVTAPQLETITHIALTEANEMSTLSSTGTPSMTEPYTISSVITSTEDSHVSFETPSTPTFEVTIDESTQNPSSDPSLTQESTPTSQYDTSSNSFNSETITTEATSDRLYQTVVTTDPVHTNGAKLSSASSDTTFEALTTIESPSTKRGFTTKDMITAEDEQTTRAAERVTASTVKEVERSSSAERTTPSPQVTSQQPETSSEPPWSWWMILISVVGAASLVCLLATCTGFIYAVLSRRKRNREDRDHRRFDPSNSSASGSMESSITYNPRASIVPDPEDPRHLRY